MFLAGVEDLSDKLKPSGTCNAWLLLTGQYLLCPRAAQEAGELGQNLL